MSTGIDPKKVATVLEMKLDPTHGILSGTLELKGEKDPLVVEELRYRIVPSEGISRIEILTLKTNREWINSLGECVLPKTLDLPAVAAKALSMLK